MTQRSSRIRRRLARPLALAIGAGLVFLGAAPAANAADSIYWANFGGNSLSSANLGGGGGADLNTGATTVSAPTGTAIDAAAGRIYWADNGSSTIKFANLDGTDGGGTLDTTGASMDQVRGMVLDKTAGKIYWANQNADKISYANLNGSGGGDLDTTGATVKQPAGVAIDKAAGRIYWANDNDNAHPISYANVNNTGSGADLDTTGATASTATGPTLDTDAGQVYWVNKGNNTISIANLNGSGGSQLGVADATTVSAPFGTALDTGGGRIYWPNFDATSISYDDVSGGADLDTTGATKSNPIFPSLLEAPLGTAPPSLTGTAQVGHTVSCSQGSWAADKVSGLLYRAPASFDYAWLRDGTPIGGATASTYQVQADDSGHTIRCRVTANNFAGGTQQTSDAARMPTERVFWANPAGPGIDFANLDGSGGAGAVDTTGATLSFPLGVAIDMTSGRIYWANRDDNAHPISYANLDGTGGAGDLDITGATASSAVGTAIDPTAGKIYWANSLNNTISFANLAGGGGGQLDTTGATVSNPSGVAVDPASGRIFWSNRSDNSISYANLNNSGSGGDLDTTGATVVNPFGVAIDDAGGKVYWTNNAGAGTPAIGYAKLDGSGDGGGDLDTTGATADSATGIAVDHAGGKVWWSNTPMVGDRTISYADLNGSGGQDFASTGAPVGLALLEKPSNTAVPNITGTAAAGHDLTCDNGTWAGDQLGAFLYQAPESFARQWLRDDVEISGETASTYAVQAGDAGHVIKCQVTAQNLGGAANATSAGTTIQTAPANTGLPSLSGIPAAGHTLTCNKGTWSGSTPQTYTYAWFRDNVAISGETASTYAVQPGDTGHVIKCRVTAQNDAGSASATSAGKVIQTPPQNTTAPSISGTPAAGKTLTCAKGTWSGSTPLTYSYKWLRDNAAIGAQTAATYTVKGVDVGHAIKCQVKAANNGGSATATSAGVVIKTPPANTAAPTISGTPKVGNTLSCSNGTWSGSAPITYTRQWLRAGAPIAGATGASYVATAADAGKFLTCKVTAHNVAGTASKVSAAVKVT